VSALTVVFAAGVALGYFALAFVVLPRIDLVDATPGFRRAFRIGGVAFFAGCGLTHTHIAVHAAGNGELVAWHEVVFHALQFVGVWVFVYVAVRMIDVRVEVRRKPSDLLRARVAELSRSNRDLEEFASVVSHDLKGPLSTAAGFTQLIESRAALDEESREFLGHVKTSHSQIRDLLDGVLRYSRAAGEGLERRPVDLGELVREVEAALAGEISATGAEVRAGDLPVVTGDPVQLRQVLLNLVSNALKFHGEAPPVLEISSQADGDNFLIRVRDHRPGIPEGERGRIFEMFQQGEAGEATAGTGIGLAVCRKVVERHGGRISVESAPDGGAVFCVSLPGADSGSDAAAGI
jgi:signal transduction histidine kinase